jgi:hypothetical protein
VIHQCESCGVALVDRVATKEAPYAYTASGLKDVFLIGIRIKECSACKLRMPIIPRIGELHRLISTVLVRTNGRLRGDQIRFLRKHAGLPANAFARLVGVTPEHLSRVENGHYEGLGEQGDRLVRFCVMAIAQEGEAARETLLEIAEGDGPMPLRRPPAKIGCPGVFKLEKDKGWQHAA